MGQLSPEDLAPKKMSETFIRPDAVEFAVANNAKGHVGFTPRWVAMTLGVPVGDVWSACHRQWALGILERYERFGEWYFRKGPNFGKLK